PQEDVIKFQKKADILLLVESLKLKYRKIARLSFSTKIVDYLGAGKCIVAVGDKSCASMEYLEENNAALVANNYKKLKELLYKVVENRDIINRIGENAREVADKNHSYKDIISTVKSSIERIL
ncbi:MAG: glycosyltransferase, partial [Clostridia bacterium]|nr:glycosyltransferase [Clostridia bacterium]